MVRTVLMKSSAPGGEHVARVGLAIYTAPGSLSTRDHM